jgi:hypothetical protein
MNIGEGDQLMTLGPENPRFWESLRTEAVGWRRMPGRRQAGLYRNQERRMRKALTDYLGRASEVEAQLDRAEQSLAQRAKFDLRLEKLLRDWSALAMDAEEGYQYGLDEWKNDLSNRELLEEIVGSAGALGEKLGRLIAPWDERFKRATVRSAQPAGGFMKEGRLLGRYETGWWWFRYPQVLLAESSDLRGGEAHLWDAEGRPLPDVARRVERQWKGILDGGRTEHPA